MAFLDFRLGKTVDLFGEVDHLISSTVIQKLASEHSSLSSFVCTASGAPEQEGGGRKLLRKVIPNGFK